MAKILVIRFSALGDVAMTIPVIATFALQYPQHQITILSRESISPLFNRWIPNNLKFKGVDLKGKYNGIKGLNLLYKELEKEKFDYVADLHDVLRSKYLRARFWLSGHKTAHINKERKDKIALSRRKNKKLVPLKTSFDRYKEVFNRLGFIFDINFTSIHSERKASASFLENIIPEKKDGEKWIGIAPFAAHKGKIYPIEHQEVVVKELSKDKNNHIFLFGGGKEEQVILENWEKASENIISMAGKLTLDKEVLLMEKLDVMVSMDSSNMHLASLVNTPVVSIWGATHPYAGFMGWNQSYQNAVQIDIPCRPCSIFGNKPCIYGDYRCMTAITPSMVIDKVKQIII